MPSALRQEPSLATRDSRGKGVREVRLSGSWTAAALRARPDPLAALRGVAGERDALWDLRGVEAFDATAAAVLWAAWGRRRPEQLLLEPQQELLVSRLAQLPELRVADERRAAASERVAQLGERALGLLDHLRGIVALTGQLVLDLLRLAREPERIPWREISAGVHRAGASALPITAMVGFLIGVVVSYLSAQQLRTFGANVYIVNLLGVSVLRELGPLLAAILVAGRSGSAMTAQIGVMHVTQELDALSALGISPTTRLVLPRVVSLTIALPLLVLWTDLIALWGGMLASGFELGIGLPFFLERLPRVVPAVNLWIGVAKGAVFGALIAIVACHFGLRIRPNTESLGAGTTASVVAATTLVLVADALFAVALSGVGLTGAAQ
jgi:phospholipid/cholesterol/gamma-HCH transport system permease protein